ncbi:MAG: hypothetical protein GY722_03130 [bacterium]|nr:hypothetical protein [bacterium]
MSRSTILSLFFVIGCLVFASPATTQPLAMTSSNGCDVWTAVDGGLEFHEFGHVATLIMQRVGSDQRVTFDFECIDFPTEPEADPMGIQQSVSICNFRMKENGVKGTTRAEVRWFPDPAIPGRLEFSANAQVIRGNRYPTGVTSVRGSVDQTTGTIETESFVAVFCRQLDS